MFPSRALGALLLTLALSLVAPPVSLISTAHAQPSDAPSGPAPSGPAGSGGAETPSGPSAPPIAAPAFVPPAAPNPSQSNVPVFSLFGGGLSPEIARFEFHPTFTLSEQYTDNFFLLPVRQQENFRTTLSPGFVFLANTPKTQGSVSTSLSFAYDTVTSQQQFHFFPNIAAMLRYQYSPRLTLTLTETLNTGDDTLQADTFGLRGPERRQFLTNSLGLTADWQIDQFQTQFFYRQSLFMGSSNILGGNGLEDATFTNIFGANVSFPILTDNRIRLGYELSVTDVSGPTSNNPNNQSNFFGDSIGHLVFASYTRQLNANATAGLSTSLSYQTRDNSRVWNSSVFGTYGTPIGFSVSASFGYSLFSSDNRSDTSGFSTNTSISYRFGQVVTSLSVFQDFRQTYQQGEDLGVVQTRVFSATLSMPVTEVTRAVFTASYNENEPTGVGNNSSASTTKFFSASATMNSPYFTAGVRGTYGDNQLLGPVNGPVLQSGPTTTIGAFGSIPLGRWFSMNLDYTHFIREGQTRLGDVVENRATVSLRGSF